MYWVKEKYDSLKNGSNPRFHSSDKEQAINATEFLSLIFPHNWYLLWMKENFSCYWIFNLFCKNVVFNAKK